MALLFLEEEKHRNDKVVNIPKTKAVTSRLNLEPLEGATATVRPSELQKLSVSPLSARAWVLLIWKCGVFLAAVITYRYVKTYQGHIKRAAPN